MKEQNLCILIDFENIAAGTERENLGRFNTKLVMNHLKEKGRVVIARAYGDWGRFAKFKQALLEQGISMMELTSYRGQDKNRADIALVVDAMELVYSRPHIQTFVLLSGDSDFTPLVMKLRELDKRIIGLGTRKATSRLLASSCDEFIFYDNLLKRSHREEESNDETSLSPKPITSQAAFTLLVDTIKVIQRDEPRPVSAGMVKQFILRKTPTFDETDFGYSGFTDFLEAANKAELVQLINNDKGGGYLVSIKGTAPIKQKVDLPKYKHPLAQAFSEKLIEEGFHPTKHFIRHTVVHEFVDHILERRSKKKRSTLVFTYGDIARRCRKTDPSASTSEVDSILNALYKAGELYGNDQKPIRSKKANFTIKKDAEELLKTLRTFYVRLLLKQYEEEFLMSNIEALCELLWNDDAHIEETKMILQGVKVALDPQAASAAKQTSETTADIVAPKQENPEDASTSNDEGAIQNRPKTSAGIKTQESKTTASTDEDSETASKSAPAKTTQPKKAPSKRKKATSTKQSKTNTPAEDTSTDSTVDNSATSKNTTESASKEEAETKTSTKKTSTTAKKKTAKSATKKAPTSKATKKKTTAAKKTTKKTTADKQNEEGSEDSTTAKKVKKTTAKKSTTQKATADNSETATKPKKSTRKKTTKKSADTDATVEAAPKKTTRRKKSTLSDEAAKE